MNSKGEGSTRKKHHEGGEGRDGNSSTQGIMTRKTFSKWLSREQTKPKRGAQRAKTLVSATNLSG